MGFYSYSMKKRNYVAMGSFISNLYMFLNKTYQLTIFINVPYIYICFMGIFWNYSIKHPFKLPNGERRKPAWRFPHIPVTPRWMPWAKPGVPHLKHHGNLSIGMGICILTLLYIVIYIYNYYLIIVYLYIYHYVIIYIYILLSMFLPAITGHY